MIDENICFKIENNTLYLEQGLVEFDIPIFFICKDNCNVRYSCLCVDSDNLQYIVAKSDVNTILQMLKSKLKMRELFLISNEVWHIEAKEDYDEDIVKKRFTDSLLDSELPQKDAYFELRNDDIKDYMSSLTKEVLNIDILTIEKVLPVSYYKGIDLSDYNYIANNKHINKNRYCSRQTSHENILTQFTNNISNNLIINDSNTLIINDPNIFDIDSYINKEVIVNG